MSISNSKPGDLSQGDETIALSTSATGNDINPSVLGNCVIKKRFYLNRHFC